VTDVQVDAGGAPGCDDLRHAAQLIEVHENADRPDTLLMRLPVNRTGTGDLQFVGDGSFEPGSNLTVVITPTRRSPQCVFDGYVLAWRLHLDRTSSASTIDVWAQDASWLMSKGDAIREWSGLTDGQVANQIFVTHGYVPADANTDDDSPPHDPESHSLYQRATDLEFVRALARRNGKLMRVACTDTAGVRTGYFITPNVRARPAFTIDLSDRDAWSVDALDFDWDVLRPIEVDASQVALDQTSEEGVAGNATASGIPSMAAVDYPTYADGAGTLLLTPTADVSELPMRTKATLREAEWFVRCRGEATLARLGHVPRVGSVVAVQGAGSLHSGNWLVWNVVHRIVADEISFSFTLVRNAVGAAGGAAAALGAL
jgi:hypothetical protein